MPAGMPLISLRMSHAQSRHLFSSETVSIAAVATVTLPPWHADTLCTATHQDDVGITRMLFPSSTR